MRKMKRSILVFLGLLTLTGTTAASDPVLTKDELELKYSTDYLRTDDQGHGYLLVQGEPLSSQRILSLSPWDLMDLVQVLTGELVPLGRFENAELTRAWHHQVAAFAAKADAAVKVTPQDLFDPALVLWDPGYIQTKNAWGQWTIKITNREIVEADLASLSPLEVQQAVTVLTGRTYHIEFVLDHLEAFRAQLSIIPRDHF